jgi:large subunit ribosomal protein L21
MGFAVIKTGGKQYRVDEGTTLTVEKLEGEPGDTVEFGEVLVCAIDAGTVFGTPTVDGVKVSGVIVRQGRGRRILVYKKKRRKNYRRRQGHRQWETTVRVTAIGALSANPASSTSSESSASSASDS